MEAFEDRLTEWAKGRRRRFASVDELTEEYKQSRATERWVPGAHELMARSVLRKSPDGNGYELVCAPENEADDLRAGAGIQPVAEGARVRRAGHARSAPTPEFKGAPADRSGQPGARHRGRLRLQLRRRAPAICCRSRSRRRARPDAGISGEARAGMTQSSKLSSPLPDGERESWPKSVAFVSHKPITHLHRLTGRCGLVTCRIRNGFCVFAPVSVRHIVATDKRMATTAAERTAPSTGRGYPDLHDHLGRCEGRAADSDRPHDQQGHRDAPAGALAVPRRHPGEGPQGVPVHQRRRQQGPQVRHAGAGRRARRRTAKSTASASAARSRRSTQTLDARDRQPDRAARGRGCALPGDRDHRQGAGQAGHGLDGIPMPISTPGWDNAPYTTLSQYITRDPDTGVQNMGNYRGQVKAPRRLGMNPSLELRPGIYKHWVKCKRARPEAACAVVLGGPPCVAFASVQKMPEDAGRTCTSRARSSARRSTWSRRRPSTCSCRPRPRSSSRA